MKILANDSEAISHEQVSDKEGSVFWVSDVYIWVEGSFSGASPVMMHVGDITVDRSRVMKLVEWEKDVPVEWQFVDASDFDWSFENWVYGVLLPEHVADMFEPDGKRVEATISAKVNFPVALEPVRIPLYPDIEVEVVPAPEVSDDMQVELVEGTLKVETH